MGTEEKPKPKFKDKPLSNPVLSEKDVKEYWKRQINGANKGRHGQGGPNGK